MDRGRSSFFDLLEQAAHLAEEEIKHARGVAEGLSRQLQSAEDEIWAAKDEIRELKASVRSYKDIAGEAEKCLRLLLIQRDQEAFASGGKVALINSNKTIWLP
jgi:chromosome segregation ATPase